MRNLRRLRHALITIIVAAGLAPAGITAAMADVPSWVPEKYARFFHRHVDERPAWKRALGYLDISVGESGPSFALVAGVSKYPKMSGKSADLWPARLDVEKMVAYLEREPESFNEVVVLLDEDMTAENLRYFLTQYFPRRLHDSPRSRFLFAYSGHGMTVANGRGYILTDEATSLDDRFNGVISLADLRAQFQEIVDNGHQVLALINACYGVDFHRLSLAFGPEVAPRPQREGAHAITAGGAGEVTWHDPGFGDGDGPKGSIFFEAVLAALDGRADRLPNDGIVTVGELETYLKSTVGGFTDEKQNPTGGDLISTRSPGGFFFLDRSRQAERDNAKPLEGEWWASISFGGSSADVSAGATSDPQVPDPSGGASSSPAKDFMAALERLGAPVPGFEGTILDLTGDTAIANRSAEASGAGADLVALTGRWSGVAQEAGGGSFTVELEVGEGCAMNGSCGWISVPHVPCRGRLTLIDSRAEGFEFHVDEFDAASDQTVCQPGAGEVLQAQPDGTLSYTATYSGARGILSRAE